MTIQFGHNDAGKTGLPPSSMGSNLTQFVHQLRDLSPLAVPLLVTPLTRRSFIGDTGKLSDDLIDWAAGAWSSCSSDVSAPADVRLPYVFRDP